jgi:RNA polymerase sigma factor (sigma-70 family)
VVEFAALTKIGAMPSGEQDEFLLVGLATGNPDAERSFERRFGPRFELIARYAGVCLQDCEDVAQDAMLAALSQIKRGLFRNESSLGTWLEVIVRGKIADYKRGLRRISPLDAEREDDLNNLTLLLCHRPVYEIQILVRQILAQMSPQRRMVLILNRMVGLTIEEISRRTEWPTGTVGRILAEAKQEFRRLFGSSESFGERLRQRVTGADERTGSS